MLGLLSRLSGAVTGKTEVQGIAGFPKKINEDDLGMAADVPAPNTKFTKIGEYEVGAQKKITMGHGAPSTRNQGYLYAKIIDSADGTTELPGLIRFIYSDADEFNKRCILETRGETLSGSKTEIDKMTPFPEFVCPFREDGKLGEDDKILVEFKPDVTSKTVDTNTELIIPITQYS